MIKRQSLILALALLVAGSLSGTEPRRLSAQEFERICLEFSEPSGVFDTDNLLSNETSYLHVIPHLRQIVKPGRAYVGVGPDQNFTYIAQVRPQIAFIVDLRRDNLLLHLYFKQLFHSVSNRWEYVSYLFAKPLPQDFRPDLSADSRKLVQQLQGIPSDRDYFEANFDRLWQAMRRQFPQLTRDEDRPAFHRMASAFCEENFELKYRSHGRFSRPYYPSYHQLMTETDLEGRRGHFLNSEPHFQFLKAMQEENRILLVVGDFGKEGALQAVGQYLRKHGHMVSAFYVSNVEFYLFRNGTFSRFVENVQQLPIDEHSVLIRSYFSYWREHPETIPGYYVTSLVQRIQRFLELHEKTPYLDYWDMVTRDYVPNLNLSLQSSTK